MGSLFLRIVNMSIATSWLILAVILLRVVLKKAPKWMNCLLWGIVAIRLLCPISIESNLSMIPSAEVFPREVISGPSFDVNTGFNIVDTQVNDYLGDCYYEGVSVSVNNGANATVILSIAWIVGILAFVVFATVSYYRIHNKVRPSLNVRDNIWSCDDIQTPFILGVIKTRIYIPSGTDEALLPHIIAHENAHLKRRDHWWKPFGYIVLAIHWFNPFVWAAYILLCRDIELACDEKVIRDLSQRESISYSEALLSCSVNRRTVMICPLAFGEVDVKERVKRVLNYKKPAFCIIVLAVISCVVITVCFLTNPITLGDYFVLVNSDSPANTNKLSYDIQLGNQAMSGEIYVEQWTEGICVRSEPAVMTQYVECIDISMKERREDGASVGTDIQIETKQYGGSLLTYFAHPENLNVAGWAFGGYELDEKIKLSPNAEVILAAMIFDAGSGVRVFDCETLVAEPERLQNATYMIVVRAIFSTAPLENQDEATLPAEILSLNDVIALSQKGYELTWSDFEQYDYVETGSGLYIQVYKINELFELCIGGASPDREPMYMYLALTDDTDTKIDIRDGGVTEFISVHTDTKGKSLDTAISEAIFRKTLSGILVTPANDKRIKYRNVL